MKDLQRILMFAVPCFAMTVIAAARLAHGMAAPAPDYYSPLEAFGDVCIKSENHLDILRKARATGWEALNGDAVPAMVRGNDAVRWKEVRRGQIAGQSALLAVSDPLSGSYCRVYFPSTDTSAMQKQLRYLKVLGAPLGLPDFDGKLNFPEGWSAIGWHRSVGDQWRAVHYEFDAEGHGPNAAWQAIEITRQT